MNPSTFTDFIELGINKKAEVNSNTILQGIKQILISYLVELEKYLATLEDYAKI